MRAFRMTALAAAAAVLASPAAARVYTDHEALFKAARASGKLALILYTAPPPGYTSKSQELQDYVLKSTVSARMLGGRYEVAEIRFEKGGERMQKFGAGMFSKKRVKGDRVALPLWVVATPEGEFIDGGDAQTIKKGPRGWRPYVAALAGKYPRVTEKDVQKAQEILDDARKLAERRRYFKAHLLLMKIQKIWYPKKLVDGRKALAGTIEEKGIEALAEADELNTEGKFLEAALAYERIKRRFTLRMPIGPKASKKLGSLLLAHEDLREQFDRARQDEEAQDLLEDARALAAGKKTAKARTAYRLLLKRYAETPSAILATDEMAKLGVVSKAPATPGAGDSPGPVAVDNPKTPPEKGAKEAQAANLVRLAKSYHASGVKAKAAEKLRLCLKAYPDTKAAEEARTLLLQWNLGGS